MTKVNIWWDDMTVPAKCFNQENNALHNYPKVDEKLWAKYERAEKRLIKIIDEIEKAIEAK